ncbi:MAG TPA: ABC transporter permease, partial [Candidatus Omnitrophota bacterium]|nr:ABC transporter permease [Candidatus Omnitrophota bacterium]
AMLMSPTRITVIVVGISLWDFIFTSVTAFISLLFGVLIFKIDLSQANFLGSLVILILTVISFSSIGIISAAFIIVLKKGNPINWIISGLSVFFGGVFFPAEMLPASLKLVSYFIPLTYSLRGLRHAIFQGYNLKMLMPDIAMLLLFCIVLFPLSIWVFKKAIDKAKVMGSLTYY